MMQGQGKYVFEVYPQTTKAQIKRAVEASFDVEVVAVNTIRIPRELMTQYFNSRDVKTINFVSTETLLNQATEVKSFR